MMLWDFLGTSVLWKHNYRYKRFHASYTQDYFIIQKNDVDEKITLSILFWKDEWYSYSAYVQKHTQKSKYLTQPDQVICPFFLN